MRNKIHWYFSKVIVKQRCQIVEYAQKIAAYENWDKVLEIFRGDAF